ncbi:unnamed protein product [Effrenium voratum]|nr:unnamed protein product [Effrenium voratum]
MSLSQFVWHFFSSSSPNSQNRDESVETSTCAKSLSAKWRGSTTPKGAAIRRAPSKQSPCLWVLVAGCKDEKEEVQEEAAMILFISSCLVPITGLRVDLPSCVWSMMAF